LFCFFAMPTLLHQVLVRQPEQLFSQEHIVKGGGHIAGCRLSGHAELFIRCLQADLGRPDRSAYLAPCKHRLGERQPCSSVVLGTPPSGNGRQTSVAQSCKRSVETELRECCGTLVHILALHIPGILPCPGYVEVLLKSYGDRLLKGQRAG